MNDERKSKWPPILFFMITGIVFGISLYLITGWAMRAEARAQVSATSPDNADTYRQAPPQRGTPRAYRSAARR